MATGPMTLTARNARRQGYHPDSEGATARKLPYWFKIFPQKQDARAYCISIGCVSTLSKCPIILRIYPILLDITFSARLNKIRSLRDVQIGAALPHA